MIRQPGYIPYLGIFKKIQSSDVFVYLDDVQYSVGGGDNRNKIKTSTDSRYLTIPLRKPFGKIMNEVEIYNEQNWREDHKNLIKENYAKSRYFNEIWPQIEKILNKKWDKLVELNLEFFSLFNNYLEIKTKTIRSSELKIKSKSSQRLLEICKKLGGTTYISGSGGKNYLDEKIFEEEGIKVLYEKFQHPTYYQMFNRFIPNMSIIDLLFNEGPNSRKILQNAKNL